MKKTWICLTTLLLLLIPSVAMAGNEIGFYCFSCNAERTGIKSDAYEYFNQDVHIQRITCKVCNNKGMSIRSAHTETQAATCQSPAYCADCKSYYGSKADHNWGEWTADPMTHKRTCQTPDCGAVDEGRHTSEPKATCKTEQTCAICNVPYYDETNHEGEVVTSYDYHSESQHARYKYCSFCGELILVDYEAHTETIAATCQSPAYCDVCKSSYGEADPDAHDLESHDAKEATCTEIGWDAYETCSRCDYSTYAEKPARSHWYGEWAPNADGTHSATCRRGCGYRKTVPCMLLTCQLQSDAPDTAFTLCPVCGEVSDGARLVLAEAAAKAVTGKLPAGEVAVRIGALAGGEQLMSVAFERGGELTRPTGQVKITLPAELLAGYTLSLLSEDGSEAPIEFVIEEDIASFTLDFTESQTPSRLLCLVPQA